MDLDFLTAINDMLVGENMPITTHKKTSPRTCFNGVGSGRSIATTQGYALLIVEIPAIGSIAKTIFIK